MPARRRTVRFVQAGIGLAANALNSKWRRAREKVAPLHTKSQVEATFASVTKWLFAARTSHAPENAQNGGFDCLEERQILVLSQSGGRTRARTWDPLIKS